MAKLQAAASFGLGGKPTTESVFSKNHFSSETKLSPEVRQKIASLSLQRVAGNCWECPSTHEFWAVKGNSVIRLVVDEVDNGESLAPASSNNPANYLADILGDLTL
jgi:hypothetical protein